jgi:DNA processing protein
MSAPAEAERAARAALTWVAEPGDQVMGALLRVCDPAEVVTALIEGRAPRLSHVAGIPRLERALPKWAARLGDVPPEPALDRWRRDGIRLVIPGDAEWPGQLDVLGDARPWALWVRGHADLRFACLRSVSVVGTRAATGYGAHVSGELAITLAEAGWTIVSGGAWETADTQQRAPSHVPRGAPPALSGLARKFVGGQAPLSW